MKLLLLLLAALAVSAQTPQFLGILVLPPVTAGNSGTMVSCALNLTGTGASISVINGVGVLTVPVSQGSGPAVPLYLPCTPVADTIRKILLSGPH